MFINILNTRAMEFLKDIYHFCDNWPINCIGYECWVLRTTSFDWLSAADKGRTWLLLYKTVIYSNIITHNHVPSFSENILSLEFSLPRFTYVQSTEKPLKLPDWNLSCHVWSPRILFVYIFSVPKKYSALSLKLRLALDK